MTKRKSLIFFLLLVCSIQAQENTWIIDTSKSFITYSGKHILHEWEGSNQNYMVVPYSTIPVWSLVD